jgi:3'(2'), 5'-bisphosphate nucleotidase
MQRFEQRITGLIEVVRDAEAAVMDVYQSNDMDVQIKHDETPITRADIASHQILMRGLGRIFPDIPVVSEEGDEDFNRHTVATAEKFWLVDPIDGTKEFIARSGHFTVCLGLVEDNVPTFGVVSAPALGERYYGGIALGGSFLDEEEGPSALRTVAHEPLVIMGSLSNMNERTADYVAERYPGSPVVGVGSQLKLPRLASGEADVYPRIGDPLHLWDVAPGHAILSGVGGTVTRFDGSPMDYRATNFMAGDFLAKIAT